ncbi:MAG TPA: DUF455 family protein [Stellaceae bacterium]|nr:DUF455 family protein [Stellaceae bacterium]
MNPPPDSETVSVRGIKLRRDPAREPCFTVTHRFEDLQERNDNSPIALRERLHRHMHTEMQTLEIAARTLADFPDAPWELRLQIARQCWDEARHVALLHRRLLAKGGRKGEFPVINFDWGVSMMVPTLPGRLAVQNRTLEGGEMDLLRELITQWRRVGDEETSQLMDVILADEIQHVRYANHWLKALGKQTPRAFLDVIKAMQYLSQVTTAVAPKPGEKNALDVEFSSIDHNAAPPSVEDRRLAEFSDAEIGELLKQAGYGAIAPKPGT